MSSTRVLIVRVGAMGDVLHTLPAVAALRETWPNAVLDWVVDERWAPLLTVARDSPVVDRVYVAETRLWSRAPLSRATRRSIWQLRGRLREHAYEYVVDLQGTLRSAVIGRMARSHGRFGFSDPRETAARLLYGRSFTRHGTHVVEQNAALLGEALGLKLSPVRPALPRSAEAEAWADQILAPASGRTALLATTAGWGAKQWPVKHFAALARALAEERWTVLLNATHKADATPLAVLAASEGAARLVCPTVEQLVALTRRLDLVVGGDTGPLHLAAALGRPVVGLFGPTDPARNGPWGPGPSAVLRHPASHTSHKRTGTVEPGLASLQVADVLQAMEGLIPVRS